MNIKKEKLYQKDNYYILRDIPNNTIDLIYCDILYGTGKNFGDYKDIKATREEVYMHYKDRFSMMKNALKEDGTIYIQVGVKISHWIGNLLEEVFGFENIRNQIIWHYNSAPRRKNDFGQRHDIIFRCSKTDKYKFNPIREPYSSIAPRGYEKEKYYNSNGKVVGDVWQINMLGQNDKTERTGYSTQKPLALADRIIQASTNEGDLVADFYCGSGTTLVSAKQNGRHYFGCDISESAINIATKRLENTSFGGNLHIESIE